MRYLRIAIKQVPAAKLAEKAQLTGVGMWTNRHEASGKISIEED